MSSGQRPGAGGRRVRPGRGLAAARRPASMTTRVRGPGDSEQRRSADRRAAGDSSDAQPRAGQWSALRAARSRRSGHWVRPANSGSQARRVAHRGSSATTSARGWSGDPRSARDGTSASADKAAHAAANPPARRQFSLPAAPAAAAPTSAERTFYRADRPRCDGRPAQVRRARGGDDHPGHRGVGLGQQHALRPGPQPVRRQGHRSRPAARCTRPPSTSNGRPVARTAEFRVYHDVAQSIDDHGKLLADSGYYGQAMANRHDPDAFANALTGVYATDPTYGPKLIATMQQYHLYRYDTATSHATAGTPMPGNSGQGGASAGGSGSAGSGPTGSAGPGPGPVSMASVPGLAVDVPPARPAPVTRRQRRGRTSPRARSVRRRPAPAPQRTPPGTASPAPTGPTRPAPARPSPTRTTPAKAAPTTSPPTRAGRPAPSPSQSHPGARRHHVTD